MMERRSAIHGSRVVSIFGAAGPALDEVGLSAWIAQAAPGEALGRLVDIGGDHRQRNRYHVLPLDGKRGGESASRGN